jgi:hypothetical protein
MFWKGLNNYFVFMWYYLPRKRKRRASKRERERRFHISESEDSQRADRPAARLSHKLLKPQKMARGQEGALRSLISPQSEGIHGQIEIRAIL